MTKSKSISSMKRTANWSLANHTCSLVSIRGLPCSPIHQNDIAPNLVERAQVRAKAEGLNARFMEGDAEALPFEDASFDVVTSLVGAMFAPRPELVARELLRVCSPGGTIAMGNWTREGFIGQMFKTFAKFIAPSGMPSPVLWGDETVVRERLGHGVSDLKMTRRPTASPTPSAG
jgi:SAM-dependent methyltransferase